jgi:hypothetical protein
MHQLIKCMMDGCIWMVAQSELEFLCSVSSIELRSFRQFLCTLIIPVSESGAPSEMGNGKRAVATSDGICRGLKRCCVSEICMCFRLHAGISSSMLVSQYVAVSKYMQMPQIVCVSNCIQGECFRSSFTSLRGYTHFLISSK